MQDQLKRVYVWEFPVRFTHWINVLSIIALSITGIYIGAPFMHAYSSEQYIMGWMRFIHFVSAYAFLLSLIIRIYWAFEGNKFASWRVWFPFSSMRFRKMMEEWKFYGLFGKKPPHTVGHTENAGFAYFIVFALFAFEIVSGFALYAPSHPGVVWTLLGGWLVALWNLQSIRLFHHLVTYIIIAFVIVHVYIAWWLETVEKNGLMGSIFGGYKFVDGREGD